MSSLLLDAKFYSRDFDGEVTLRGYFAELLATLWDEGEEFSSKRPFGNSDWQDRLGADLTRASLVGNETDAFDSVREAIESMAIDKSAT